MWVVGERQDVAVLRLPRPRRGAHGSGMVGGPSSARGPYSVAVGHAGTVVPGRAEQTHPGRQRPYARQCRLNVAAQAAARSRGPGEGEQLVRVMLLNALTTWEPAM